MLKQLKFAAIALLVAVGFTACSEDDPAPVIPPAPITPTDSVAPADSIINPMRGEAGMYVINQGNSYGNVAGALDFIAQNGTKTDSVFFKANGKLIGDAPQKPIIYGSKMYVPVYASNLVWVLDANTATVIASVQTNQPQAVCASNGYVYISNNDGFVTRIDTTTYTKSSPLDVGPNPYGMAAANGKVYVACSDFNNSGANYANSAIAVIDEATFSKVKSLTNEGIKDPWDMAADNSGNVYFTTIAYGTANKVWKIDANDNVSALCDGTYIATNTQNRTSRATGKQDLLYVIHAVTDWSTYTTTISSSVYNAATGAQLSNNFLQTPANTTEYTFAPICMDVNPANGDIYVCSDNGSNGYAKPGYINVYTSNGAFSKRIATGIHPYGVIFK